MNILRLMGFLPPLGFDPDAKAFFTAAGITDPTQKSAIDKLVKDLKGANLWSKMVALYPMVGGTATTCKYNLKDPTQYTLTFFGSWLFSSTGAKPDGSTTSASTGFLTNTTGPQSLHIAYYSRTNDATGPQIDFGADGSENFVTAAYAGYGTGGRIYNLDATIPIVADTRGFFLVTCSGSSTRYFQINGINKSSNSGGFSSFNGPFNLGRLSNSERSKRECALASVGFGLTTTEATVFYTIVQAYQTTLGRQV